MRLQRCVSQPLSEGVAEGHCLWAPVGDRCTWAPAAGRDHHHAIYQARAVAGPFGGTPRLSAEQCLVVAEYRLAPAVVRVSFQEARTRSAGSQRTSPRWSLRCSTLVSGLSKHGSQECPTRGWNRFATEHGRGDTMRFRHLPRAISAGIALAAILTVQGCATNVGSDACPAIGYAYYGPVELQVPGQSTTTADLLACFGEDCTPTPAKASGESWGISIGESVDLGGSEHPVAVTVVVIASGSGNELARGTYPITYKRTDGGGRCPGPTAPEPVTIEAAAK
jgi:hypothetical protein